jgi:DNA-binding NarL/FixJ family response regulator
MSKPRVLLAEDNIDVAEALRRLVEIDFDLVGVVHDGLSLVQAAQNLRPDVIVTDLSMPLMSGMEAVRRLKQEGVTARIIFLTMYQEPQLADEAFRLGASAYLSKFAAGEELLDAIHALIGRPCKDGDLANRDSAGAPQGNVQPTYAATGTYGNRPGRT